MKQALQKSAVAIVASVFVLASGAAVAGERVDHYGAKEAATLEEAVANFAEYNAKLSAVLEKSELESADLETIHELTYTLETALAKIRDDLGSLAETLEALHLASEAHQTPATRNHGAAYLKTAETVIPSGPAADPSE